MHAVSRNKHAIGFVLLAKDKGLEPLITGLEPVVLPLH